jgi:hypothetical protein
MEADRLEDASQGSEAPAQPILRAVVTCSKVTEHDDGTCTLEGVSDQFTTEWRPTPELLAPVSFVVYAELLAYEMFGSPSDERLRLEIVTEDGVSLGSDEAAPMSWGNGCSKNIVYFPERFSVAEPEVILLLNLFWGDRLLVGGMPVWIWEPGYKSEKFRGWKRPAAGPNLN